MIFTKNGTAMLMRCPSYDLFLIVGVLFGKNFYAIRIDKQFDSTKGCFSYSDLFLTKTNNKCADGVTSTSSTDKKNHIKAIRISLIKRGTFLHTLYHSVFTTILSNKARM